jgi:hypothetical protein
MKPGATPIERFEGWYARPIEKLSELPEGDGAFAALMIAMPLYERYIVAKLKLAGSGTSDDEVRDEMGKDLVLDAGKRSVFWSVFRSGFTHQAMGRDGKTKWLVSHTFSELPTFQTIDGHQYVCLDPWKFAERLLNKFRADEQLITASDSFPLADVFRM